MYYNVGKQILFDNTHIADARDVATAEKIASALNSQARANHMVDDLEYHDTQPPLFDEPAPVHRSACQPRREGDEYYCPGCAKRWGYDETPPGCHAFV